MLNYLWAFMLLVGVCWGMVTGQMEAVTNGALDSSKEAVTLCITMLGVMSLWTGLMEVARRGGLLEKMTRLIAPFVNWMFPSIPEGHPAKEHITTNFIANFLGLGWAATPAGLHAMEQLGELNEHKKTASNEMCTFLIMNISSLQLIPVNIIAYRSQYGSVNPAAIVGPGIIATLMSTIVAVIFCKIMDRKKQNRKEKSSIIQKE